MTDDEARELVPGQLVETRVGAVWREVELVAILSAGPFPLLLLRRTGKTAAGAAFGPLRRQPLHLRPHPTGLYGRLSANVYADFLTERGEERAARLLRDAFPLDDGKESPK